jgi:hypothetical protein
MKLVDRQQALVDEINEREAPDGETALELLQAVYRNKLVPLHTRIRCASLALPFESPKLSVVGVTRDDATFAFALERAIERSRSGKVTLELQANPEAGEVAAAAVGKVTPRRFG